MFVIISYDITDNKRRQKMAKTLKDYGMRVQYSVFECIVEHEQLEEIKKSITHILSEEDKVRIYNICNSCKNKIYNYGEGRYLEDPLVYVV